jgi:hypothetical protein
MKKKDYLKFLFPFSLSFFSLSLSMGSFFGFLFTKIYVEKLIPKFSFPKSLFLPFFRNLKLKIHHWILGCLIIISGFLLDIQFLLQPFSLGCLMGVVYHDLVEDKDRFKILIKKNEFN